ncbi:MAG: single-stranded DNA-binding protein [Prevotella sp.]|nr:single-stranded DNA-binding protein [Prevotella sp.]
MINKSVLIGRLTSDPILKYTPGQGTAVTTVTIAVDRQKTKDGKKEADFIPVVIWGKQAESTAQYVSKGKLIGIAGRIQTRSYEHKDGYKVYVTEVVAEEVQFLQWAKDSDANSSSGSDYEDMTPIDDDSIPF